MTIFERINAMSVEEVAAWVDENHSELINYCFCKSDCAADYDCPHLRQCIVNWLNSPSENCHLFK